MRKLFLHRSVSAYFLMGSAAVELIGILFYIINSLSEYYKSISPMVLILLAVSLLASVTLLVLSELRGNKRYLTLIYIVNVVSASVALMKAIDTRILSLSIVLFSTLETTNKTAQSAVMFFLVTAVLLLVSIILLMISAFGPLKKGGKTE